MTASTPPLPKEELEEMKRELEKIHGLCDDDEKRACYDFVYDEVPRLLSEVERQRGEIEELNSLKDLKRMNQSLSDLCDTLEKKLEIADGGLGGLYNRACQTMLLDGQKIERLESLLKEAEEMAKFYAELSVEMEFREGVPYPGFAQDGGEKASKWLSSLQKYEMRGEFKVEIDPEKMVPKNKGDS